MMRAKPPSFKSDDSDVEELIQLKADCRNVLHGRPPFFFPHFFICMGVQKAVMRGSELGRNHQPLG